MLSLIVTSTPFTHLASDLTSSTNVVILAYVLFPPQVAPVPLKGIQEASLLLDHNFASSSESVLMNKENGERKDHQNYQHVCPNLKCQRTKTGLLVEESECIWTATHTMQPYIPLRYLGAS